MQTIWHDDTGRVKAVYDGDTSSTVWQERGYSKAVSDPKKNGRLSQDHVVTVEDGVVTEAVYSPLPQPLDEYKSEAGVRLDTFAGEVRGRFPSPGYLIDEEYAQAESRAQAFADAGYPSEDVPDEVQSWADASGMGAQAAADDILAIAQAWRGAVAAVRRARLEGKAAIAASADHDAVDVAETDARAALDAIQPGG